jgi:hypothetical protein
MVDRDEILARIREAQPNHMGNWALIYELGNKVVKIFGGIHVCGEEESKKQSQQESNNLRRIINISDNRIIVPTPYDTLMICESKELESYVEKLKWLYRDDPRSEFDVYGVVMEFIQGTSLEELPRFERKNYRHSLQEMIDALMEHKIGKYDLKPKEIICIKDSDKVGLVDVHEVTFGNIESHIRKYRGIMGHIPDDSEPKPLF